MTMQTTTPPTPRTPVVGNPPTAVREATRTFTKRATVACLAGLFAVAGYGISTANPSTGEIISALGMWSVALLATYMAVGYGDHRLSKGMPSLVDILATTFASRRGRGDGYQPGGIE